MDSGAKNLCRPRAHQSDFSAFPPSKLRKLELGKNRGENDKLIEKLVITQEFINVMPTQHRILWLSATILQAVSITSENQFCTPGHHWCSVGLEWSFLDHLHFKHSFWHRSRDGYSLHIHPLSHCKGTPGKSLLGCWSWRSHLHRTLSIWRPDAVMCPGSLLTSKKQSHVRKQAEIRVL